jgi:hypothetical protein
MDVTNTFQVARGRHYGLARSDLSCEVRRGYTLLVGPNTSAKSSLPSSTVLLGDD